MQNLRSQDVRDTTRLIVFERSGVWAKQLESVTESQWLVETRSFNQLREAAAEYPTSLAVLETTGDNVIRVARCAEELHKRHPRLTTAAALVDGAKDPSPWQSNAQRVLRELGVAAVIRSARDVDIVAAWWQRQRDCYPPIETTLRDRLYARLPWAS